MYVFVQLKILVQNTSMTNMLFIYFLCYVMVYICRVEYCIGLSSVGIFLNASSRKTRATRFVSGASLLY